MGRKQLKINFMEIEKLNTLLKESGDIVEKHYISVREKGEDFNVFSILGMETNETKTHSAMLVSLLDPKGNHYYDEKFLRLFLQEIGYTSFIDSDLKNVKVKVEHHLGKILDDFTSGGFIDILITFPSGKAIAIENKIHAEDQPKQMYRYSLFKGNDCTLFYLNLFGEKGKPTKKSLHTLTDKDFEVITYKNHILNWLEACLSVVKPDSIVKNAVKQYQILIRDLTNSMEKDLENNFITLIQNNLEEAKYIHSHYQKTVDSIREKLRKAVCEEINNLQLNVKARLGNDINHNYSKIWISSEILHKKGIQIGIESFSGKGNNKGRLFIGIFDRQKAYESIRDGDFRLSNFWPIVSDIKTPEKNALNLSSTSILEKLNNNDEYYFENMVATIVHQTKSFIETYGNI